MNWRRYIKQYFSLLLLIVSFHKTTSISPSKTVNKTSRPEESRNEKNCLKYDYQIYDALTSTKPPFDNYFNISSAIYPSEDISSKLVNIWVHFINSTVNHTEVDQRKFIWSRSCLYVSDRYLSLRAMSLYSLATIWPDRRQEDLHITIYEFCDPRQKKKKLLKFLSTLEDIAIDPSNFDPSLNNVECVVEASYKHHFENVNKAFPQICWLILCSSLIGSNFISTLFLQYCKKQYTSKPGILRVKSALLFIFVLFWLGIIVAIIAASHSMQEQLIYPLTYLVLIFLVCIRRFLYCLSRKHIKCENRKITSWKFEKDGNAESGWGFLCTAYPGCFIAVHHILWVMIGIITEPFWALPVVTTFVMLAFLFYVLSSLYFSFQTWEMWQTINFVLLVAVAISVMLVQFSFLLIGHQFFDESLISSAIQSALVVIISIWLRSSEEDEDTDSRLINNDEAEDNVDGCNTPRIEGDQISLVSSNELQIPT
ncbi:hypothetical protein ACROYT_G016314 [Oculina patagonica]